MHVSATDRQIIDCQPSPFSSPFLSSSFPLLFFSVLLPEFMQRPGLELYQCISELCLFLWDRYPFSLFSFFASFPSHSLLPSLFPLHYPRSLSLSFALLFIFFSFLILSFSLFPLFFSLFSLLSSFSLSFFRSSLHLLFFSFFFRSSLNLLSFLFLFFLLVFPLSPLSFSE